MYSNMPLAWELKKLKVASRSMASFTCRCDIIGPSMCKWVLAGKSTLHIWPLPGIRPGLNQSRRESKHAAGEFQVLSKLHILKQ